MNQCQLLVIYFKYGSQEAKLVLVVVGGSGPNLFVRNWLKYIGLDWAKIAAVRSTQSKPT